MIEECTSRFGIIYFLEEIGEKGISLSGGQKAR